MKNICLLAAALVLLLAPTAQAASAQKKTAAFSLSQVLSQCDAMKEIRADLEKRFAPEQNALSQEEQALVKELQDKKINQEEANRKREELARKIMDFRQRSQAAQMDADNRIREMLLASGKALAQKNGYGIILNADEALFIDPSWDITKAVLTEFNAQWKKRKK